MDRSTIKGTGLADRLFPGPPGGRTLGREVIGGITTFAALSYILFVQPAVLSQAGMDFQSVLLATCLGVKFRISGLVKGENKANKNGFVLQTKDLLALFRNFILFAIPFLFPCSLFPIPSLRTSCVLCGKSRFPTILRRLTIHVLLTPGWSAFRGESNKIIPRLPRIPREPEKQVLGARC